ncbi:DNA cytosine methyltransferase [Vibrio sp. S17_S38]|uniref:DNA cytosine methyltransferase n=1 Tax=Vibrio sp. S17_S38 TaxID=2720229 RepID=UPI001680BFFF|nr:DNA cytosine methyltransferase [Vibrio sp. S17_S38]MBD1572919.1 DNA cytosine methyltransferase [Vibrio sp. S17_S38]
MINKNEIIVDNFAGGGGASTGIEMALGRSVDIAINHDPDAIDMHRLNHPDTKHYCESVWDVDPIEACDGRPVGLAWFSPDCKHFSKAKGNRPVDKSIRGLAWVAVRWAALVKPRMLMLENVEEFLTWGPVVEVSPGKFKPCPDRKGETFEAFIKALSTGLDIHHPAWDEIKTAIGDEFPYEQLERGLGYNIEWNVLRACDYGAPTIRKRFFLVARNDGEDIQWPLPTHGVKGSGLLPYRTAADIIDWSIPVKSIFGRKKPLVEATIKRIVKGLDKFIFNNDNPFIVPEKHALPFITEYANSSNQRVFAGNEPLRTLTSATQGLNFAVVTAFIAKHFTGANGSSMNAPLATVTQVDHNALVTSHMVKLRGDNIGHATDEPVHTISAGGLHIGEVRAFLIQYYGTSTGHELDRPLGTVTTKDRFGLVTIKGEQYQIVDIGMRMLEPHELFAAQSFPDDYVIAHDSSGKKLSKTKQVARCGNAVPPLVAKALVEANMNVNIVAEQVAA